MGLWVLSASCVSFLPRTNPGLRVLKCTCLSPGPDTLSDLGGVTCRHPSSQGVLHLKNSFEPSAL